MEGSSSAFREHTHKAYTDSVMQRSQHVANGTTLVWRPQVYFGRCFIVRAFALCVSMCLCVFLPHLAWTSLGPSIYTAGCLFEFALANTPLDLPFALRAIPGSSLSLDQACCLAHWRSLQANLSPTRVQEDQNHSAPPSHHRETLAASPRLAPQKAWNVSWRTSACASNEVCFLQGRLNA